MTAFDFFAAGSPFLNHPLLTAERTRQELDFLLGFFVGELSLPAHAQLLDVGCGFGRHSVELARRGYRVTGIDPSGALIDAAREAAAQAGVAVTFRAASGEAFAAADPHAQPFDGAVCLFTTLGQMDQTGGGDNRALLPAVAGRLKPGAGFALELPQKGPALAGLKAHDRFGGEESYTDVQRRYDPATDSVTERFRLVSPAGERLYVLRYRLFGRADVEWMLHAAGLEVLYTHAGYSPAPLQADSPVMLFLCRKPDGNG